MLKNAMFAGLALAGTLASFAGTVQPVRAQDVATVRPPSSQVERVHYQASELTTAEGIRGLTKRVRSAAHRVCAPSQDTFVATYSELRCFHPTMMDAIAQIDRAVARSGGNSLAGNTTITVGVR